MIDVKLRNYKEEPGNGSLMKEEIDVLKAVLLEVLAKDGMPEKGTFSIRAQTLAQETSGICGYSNVFSFNFPKGEQKHYLGDFRSSDTIANWTLNDAVGYSRRADRGGITEHGRGCPVWFSAEMTNGRLVAIFLADNGNTLTQNKVYLTLAKTLSRLCPNDKVLSRAIIEALNSEFDNQSWVKKLLETIDEMFENPRISEIKTWKKWHEKNLDWATLR